MKKIIYAGYLILLFLLFLYSYTQIDLSLTFSRIDFLREAVKSFQYIGYFNRPLSAFFFILIVVLLFNFYISFIIMVLTRQISAKIIWKLIIASAAILAFSYNAFSYDLFNYIFDAKILTHYQQNPYLYKALDFPGDPMLSFMHWTHRVYPYGPFWLLLTTPLSYLGSNLFIPTFILFKLLMTLSFIGTVYYIGKIMQKISPQHYLLGITFFAFNPLVLVESLISAHIDIVMIFFTAWSLFQLVNNKKISAYTLLVFSAGIKFVTSALLPVYFIVSYLQFKQKKINWNLVFYCCLLIMIIAAVYAAQRTNFQPWYLLEILFFASFIPRKYFIFIPSVIISLFALLNYTPYLYLGNWDPPVPLIINYLNISSYILSLLTVAVYFLIKKYRKPTRKK